jgi:hypothetical protein
MFWAFQYRKKLCDCYNRKRDLCKRAVCKFLGLTLLLRIGTLWRGGDGRFFEVPPLTNDALLTTLHPLLENVLQTVCRKLQEEPRSSLFMVGKAQKSHGVRSGLHCGCCSKGVPASHFFQAEHRIKFSPHPLRFLGFSNHEKGAPRQKISKWSTVCSTYSRSGWSVVRSASLAKVGTSKKRPSPHLHEVPTRINKASPRTFQTALVYDIHITKKTHLNKSLKCLFTLSSFSCQVASNALIFSSHLIIGCPFHLGRLGWWRRIYYVFFVYSFYSCVPSIFFDN